MKRFLSTLLTVFLTACGAAATPAPTVAPPKPTAAPAAATPAADAGLLKLQTLERDQVFAREMAEYLDAAYYKGLGQPVPAFLKPEEESATNPKSVKDEKIAINLAGFYALEVGLTALMDRTPSATPVALLDAINKGTMSADDLNLLARFANATWKAGQPFRALSRITRDTFKPAALLSADDVAKDVTQIKAAAGLLAPLMEPARDKDAKTQLEKLQAILRDQAVSTDIAIGLDAAYYKGLNQPVPPFVTKEEETATAAKSVKEEKIAQNLAGFYALEVGMTAIAERNKTTPLKVLEQFNAGQLSQADQLMLARFANATWKAGQPFRALNRITRDTFKPAALLSADDVAKDVAQIKSAGEKLAASLK